MSYRCAGCHSMNGNVAVGPSFKGLAGSDVKLTNGKTVTADDAYLIRSITKPDSQIVSGFKPGVMSTTIAPGSISAEQARSLIAFIKTLD
jgi:cytochrome c oxidase subunit 2